VAAVLTWIALFVAALLSMEAVAYLTHRYLMHGPLWCLHRSHHLPHRHRLEWNDLFGLLFAVPSIILIDLGARQGHSLLLPIGLGMTGYGVIYFLFHDVVVHRRLRLPRVPQTPYLRRIIKAHLVHHRTHQRNGAESFGFLYAPTTFRERPPSTSRSRR
jgi:beta-carotene 3-hydroxylase